MTDYIYEGKRDKILTLLGIREDAPKKCRIHKIEHSDKLLRIGKLYCSDRHLTTDVFHDDDVTLAASKDEALKIKKETEKEACYACWGNLNLQYIVEWNEK